MLIVVDQFEELFTSNPEHWEQRAGFFEQLAEALAADPYLHAVTGDPPGHHRPGLPRVRVLIPPWLSLLWVSLVWVRGPDLLGHRTQ